ncbi:hypothetical protein M2337_002417 [Sphingobium sp. B2D3A]|uniref:lasso peptide biosynthesis B2 protein n=1 Tax=unclassified Sphingobium TaxID=2611147 RepID=UPI0039B667D8|nr:hypothetical protein [Sphingobium sp. B2D3A]MCW2384643.1 hypothetical protein [Sphingobium sp. B2D3D]
MIREGLYFCECKGRTVLLDILADRYFLLPDDHSPAFRRYVREEPLLDHDATALEYLRSKDLLSYDAACLRTCDGMREITRPSREFAGQETMPNIVAGLHCLIAQWIAARQVRRRPLAGIIKSLRGGYRRATPENLELALRKVVGGLAWSSGLIDQLNQCLPRSIAFHRVCLASGIPSTLVFGVTIDPFSAHCWVQMDDLLLSDRLERVRIFTPIMAL